MVGKSGRLAVTTGLDVATGLDASELDVWNSGTTERGGGSLKIYAVRHAQAEARSPEGDGLLRPLSDRGSEQAEALAEHFADAPPARIISSPALRCQQTVEPLAVAHRIPVEVDERLAEGESPERVAELFRAADGGPVLLCTHGDVIPALLAVLELTGVDSGERPPCRKGSVWELKGRGYTPTRARYFEPERSSKRGRKAFLREFERPSSVRAAVLDMGSTSFHLLIADVTPEGEITPVVRENVMLRLGAVIATQSKIPREVRQRAVERARELEAVARREKAQRLIPVATAALREASNGREVADRIGEAIGEPVRLLSGEEEARVIFRAFAARMEIGKRAVLGLDLGGGSVELAVGSRDRIMAEASLPLGAVRLHGELVAGDPMRKRERREIRQRVCGALAPHREALLRHAPQDAIVAGGAVRALARLIDEKLVVRADRNQSTRIATDTLRELADKLVRSSHEERLRMRGIRKPRADVLPTAAIILTTLADELGIESLRICSWGLREGTLLEAFAPEA